MVWSHECSIIFVFSTSTCTAQLDSTQRGFGRFPLPPQCGWGRYSKAAQKSSDVVCMQSKDNTTMEEVEAMVHLLHALWLLVRLRVKERAKSVCSHSPAAVAGFESCKRVPLMTHSVTSFVGQSVACGLLTSLFQLDSRHLENGQSKH